MNTASLYIQAAAEGAFDARNIQHQSGIPSVYVLGFEAVRNCGYKHRRFAPWLIHKGRDPVAAACYLLASIPDAEIMQLLTIVNPNIPVSTCISALVQSASSTFSARLYKYFEGVTGVKVSTKRKIAEISTDILLSFSYSVVISQSIRLQHELQNCTNVLVRTHGRAEQFLGMANNLVHELRKKDNAIMALLELQSEAVESRICTGEIHARIDKITDMLAHQSGSKNSSNAPAPRASTPPSWWNEADSAGRSEVSMLLAAASFIDS